MQDYNYIWHGCMEVTLELSCCKFPPAVELVKFWQDNRASLLQFVGEAHRGVKGFVKDERGVPIEGASMKVSPLLVRIQINETSSALASTCLNLTNVNVLISSQIKGRDVGFQTTKEGEFWRILLPGIYSIEVFAEGFQPREVQFAVIEQNPTLLNITLLHHDTTRRSGASASKLEQEELKEKLLKEQQNKEEQETEEEQGLFGLPNPFSSIQKSVKKLLDNIPVIG